MRVWIETIVNNPASQADFLAYISELEAVLTSKCQKLLIEDKAREAQLLAYELKVYQRIRETFIIATREAQAVMEFESKKGRNL